MGKVRFLMDVHVHRVITDGLRRRGVEVLTCQEAALSTFEDIDILAYADQHNWTVFSQDADFLQLCASGQIVHKGVIYSHKQNSIGRIIQGLMLIHEVLEPIEMVNHLEFV